MNIDARPGVDPAAWCRCLLMAFGGTAILLAPNGAIATTYVVNSPADLLDVNPGDDVCETAVGNGVCTLRGAIQESNAHGGQDAILLQPDATYLLSRTGSDTGNSLAGDLDIYDSVAISTAGSNATIDGNALDRVIEVQKCIGRLGGPSTPCTIGVVQADISGVTIRNGRTGSFGAGVAAIGNLTLTNCVVSGNNAVGINSWGGGVYNGSSGGSLTMSRCVVSGNTAGPGNPQGAGIRSEGPLTIVDSAISGNTTSGNGGGVFVIASNATIVGSTISGNSATTGGGIHTSLGSGLIVINSTISGNSSNANGGGVYSDTGTTALYNATIALNRANADGLGEAAGGGVSSVAGNVFTLSGSIISANQSQMPTVPTPTLVVDDCEGTLTSHGNNIVSDVDATHCTVNGPFNPADANLGPLQDNGGTTLTHGLLGTSPAIDGGNSGGCPDNAGAVLTSDQRGADRPQGPRCDIGAFEAPERFFADGFES